MKYGFNLLSVGSIAVSLAIYLASDRSKVFAIGCDTYYRVTGQIAGCTDVSTEKAQEAWLEKYSICLEQQLAQEITIYRGKLQTYYAEWKSADLGRDLEFDRISLPDIDTSSLSLSSTTYRGNADFCDL